MRSQGLDGRGLAVDNTFLVEATSFEGRSALCFGKGLPVSLLLLLLWLGR